MTVDEYGHRPVAPVRRDPSPATAGRLIGIVVVGCSSESKIVALYSMPVSAVARQRPLPCGEVDALAGEVIAGQFARLPVLDDEDADR